MVKVKNHISKCCANLLILNIQRKCDDRVCHIELKLPNLLNILEESLQVNFIIDKKIHLSEKNYSYTGKMYIKSICKNPPNKR